MRTRAYRRHQRARTIARHLRDWRSIYSGDESRWGPMPPPKDIAVRHPFDCGRRCELCHGDKFEKLRRVREEREWRRYEEGASSGW